VDPFSTIESVMVGPVTGTTPGYSSLAVTIIDGATVSIMRSYFENLLEISVAKALTTTIELITYTQLNGTTLNGDAVMSNVFKLPVTIGYGSLVANLTMAEGSYCLATPSDMAGSTCTPGQDMPAEVSYLAGLPLCESMGDGGAPTAEDGGAP
jgi:hypothetical protein